MRAALPLTITTSLALGVLAGCGGDGGEGGRPENPVAAMERLLDCRPSDRNFAPARTDLGPLGQCLLRADRENWESIDGLSLSIICLGGPGAAPSADELTDRGVAECMIENGAPTDA